MIGIEHLKRRVDSLAPAAMKEDPKNELEEMTDEDLARALLASPDADRCGGGITSLSNQRLADLLLRDRSTTPGPGADGQDRNL